VGISRLLKGTPRAVPDNFIEHKLNIDASVMPRRQNLRKMSDDKMVAVKSEVQ
jgi:hypothetical protein